MKSKQEFQGSGILFLKYVFLYVVVTAPILSFCLMGMNFLPVLVTLFFIAIPAVLLIGLLISRFDGFSFDDAQSQIVKASGKRIPYSKIQKLIIRETGSMCQIVVQYGFMRKIALSSAFNTKDKSHALESILKRLPDLSVQETRYADWKTIGILMTTIVFLTAVFHVVLYRTSNTIAHMPQQVAWKVSERAFKNVSAHSLGEFGIAMPEQFELTSEDPDVLQFHAMNDHVWVKFVIPAEKSNAHIALRFIRYATGVQNYYDVLETAYTARIGILPLVIKYIALQRFDDVNLYAFQQTSALPQKKQSRKKEKPSPAVVSMIKGFIAQGRNKTQEVSTMLLTDMSGMKELHVVISGPKRLDEQELKKITAAVYLQPSR
ncbi:MAG: hypothetical protein WC539_06105 [Nitrospirota bacterium]